MSDIDLDAIRRRAEQTRPGVDGVRPVRPGLPRAAYEDREALLATVERLTESLDAARSVAEYLEDEVSMERNRTIKAEAERDELRASRTALRRKVAAEQAKTLRAEWVIDRVRALVDESRRTGRRLSALDVVDALHPQEPHTPAQDASSTPDGSEGAGSGNGAQIAGNACGDRLGTWHGPIGPCVLTGRHTLHDDGEGITWSRSEVPMSQEEA